VRFALHRLLVGMLPLLLAAGFVMSSGAPPSLRVAASCVIGVCVVTAMVFLPLQAIAHVKVGASAGRLAASGMWLRQTALAFRSVYRP
jgi:hypothetical protein